LSRIDSGQYGDCPRVWRRHRSGAPANRAAYPLLRPMPPRRGDRSTALRAEGPAHGESEAEPVGGGQASSAGQVYEVADTRQRSSPAIAEQARGQCAGQTASWKCADVEAWVSRLRDPCLRGGFDDRPASSCTAHSG
jgi:hypothetical protein